MTLSAHQVDRVLSMWEGSPHQRPAPPAPRRMASPYGLRDVPDMPDVDPVAFEELCRQCEMVSAAEEGMTVEAYRALNQRRLIDPFCD